MTSACATKRVFLRRKAARKAARRARLYYYECQDCGNYHLTKWAPGELEYSQKRHATLNRTPHTEENWRGKNGSARSKTV